MSDKSYIINEYKELRNEIMQKIELQNSLMTFMITTVVAVLAFAIGSDNSYMYLLPFGIIIPISMRITYYRTAMVKLSAYIIIYLENDLEGINWETRNVNLMGENKGGIYDKVTISHYYEGILLSIVCYILFCLDYLKDKLVNYQVIVSLILPLGFVMWEMIITVRSASIDKEKLNWIERWEDFKQYEQNTVD